MQTHYLISIQEIMYKIFKLNHPFIKEKTVKNTIVNVNITKNNPFKSLNYYV
jgi:hypothetical protein